ncbi:MAG: diaminopimelate epimerase, partial [Thermoguttaceae bacterium]
MNFTKMHGIGNDYVYVNCFKEPIPTNIEKLAIAISDRHFGVGADGLVLILPPDSPEQADARMRMFNADGSESEMCGNAIRCVGKFIFDHDIVRKQTVRIETLAGVKTLQLIYGTPDSVDKPDTADKDKPDKNSCQVVLSVRVDMGEPILTPANIPTLLRSAENDNSPVINVPFGSVLGAKWGDKGVTCVSMGNPHCVIFDIALSDENVHGLGPAIEND